MKFRTILPLILAVLVPQAGVAAGNTVNPGAPDTPPTPADTTMTDIMLGEITVQAPRVIHKADMDVLYPSASAVKASQNGVALLKYLMIPTLSVNEFTGTIRTAGQDVQVRINGRKASMDQLQSIDPSTVKRIEWIDDAGLRYGDAPAVINVIVANPTVGGSIMAQGTQSLTQPWGMGYASLKLNNGRSQWSADLNGRYTNKVDTYREYSETFTRSDGSSVSRTETPVDGHVSMTNINPRISYSYINSDKTTLWIGAGVNKEWPTERANTGIMSLTGSDRKILLHEKSASSGVRPNINAYFEQKLPYSQTIAIDVDASLLNGRSSHIYRESESGDDAPVTDVSTFLKDRQKSISIEGNYIKRFSDKRITAGVQYAGTRSRSIRESGSVSRQRQERTYLFGEYFQRVGHVNLTAGVGGQYVDLKTLDSGKGSSSWSWRPRLSASYRLDNTSQFRLSLTSRTSTPSASQTDPNTQQIDGFQYQTGNQDLRTYNTYNVKLQYNFTFPRVSGQFEGQWNRAPHAIAPYLHWEGERLITSFENSRGHTAWQVSLSPQIDIIPQLLTAKGTLRFYRAHSAGTGYSHYFTAWSGDVGLMATYRSFMLSATYEVNPSTLSGETISRNEKISIAMLSYRWKGFTFIGGVFMPFNRYSMGSESLNRYNSNRNVLRSNGFNCMPTVQIAYNFNWGRQKRGAQKLINADGDIQQSKAAGR